jgi:hypothetical protein
MKNAGKLIFVRDIFKSWYVCGISDRYSSIDDMIDFLKEETKGYKVITVGNSAGGYMAVLAGVLLGAERVFNFSGQYSLRIIENCIETNELLKNIRMILETSIMILRHM